MRGWLSGLVISYDVCPIYFWTLEEVMDCIKKELAESDKRLAETRDILEAEK